MINTIREFLRLESASGILLVVAAVIAMVVENSPAEPLYDRLLDTRVVFAIGTFEIAKPLLLWINDGLMAVFFFLVGLEIKREVIQGELSDPAKVTLPVVGALGGMTIPALIYAAINWNNDSGLQGWAIPSATDIAFALGVLSLLGNRVPQSLKLFLMTLAIIDDLGAIVIIALFYTADISTNSLVVAGACLVVLAVLNKRGVTTLPPFLLVGMIMWTAVLKSGVHATLAGVLLAFFIPLGSKENTGKSLLEKLEHDLHPTVAFFILPLFAFANTGISLSGLGPESILSPVPLGIALGLFFGNQIGVFGFCWLAVKMKLAKLPADLDWTKLYGVAVLCGIGFTMSLFISSLAFEGTQVNQMIDDRLGILLGSICSALVGYAILNWRLKAPEPAAVA